MTRFEKLTQDEETLAKYIEALIAYLLEDSTIMDVERRTKWLKEEEKEAQA